MSNTQAMRRVAQCILDSWSHVGSMAHIASELADIAEFLGVKEDSE